MAKTTRYIHWLGAGLASVPGIRRLIENGRAVKIWERDISKAQSAMEGLKGRAEICDANVRDLADEISAGDVVVSMLPAGLHPDIAKLCLEHKAHFVSSSYISPQMNALDEQAKQDGLVFINEMGLDPGIDHLLAHLLVADYKTSAIYDPINEIEFRSYCGGFPAQANDFRYKFSWSPIGVLKALLSPARAILKGKDMTIKRPWHAIEDYHVDFDRGGEWFEAYPNRDSLPFMDDYGFQGDWRVTQFVRGTLRLGGWSKAWSNIFKTLERTEHKGEEKELVELSDRLWQDHAYQAGEFDRVVLSVDLRVKRNGSTLWHKSKCLDSFGTEVSSAMGRLVSIPVSLAAEAVLEEELAPGVQPAPRDINLIHRWLKEIAIHGDHVQHIDHVPFIFKDAAE